MINWDRPIMIGNNRAVTAATTIDAIRILLIKSVALADFLTTLFFFLGADMRILALGFYQSFGEIRKTFQAEKKHSN